MKTEKGLVTVPGFFFFHNNFHKKIPEFEKKYEINVLEDFWKYSFKEFLECSRYISSYLPKLNIDLELISGAHFMHILSMKVFLTLYSMSMDQCFDIAPSLKTLRSEKNFLATENPLEMIKTLFISSLNSLFVLKMFNFLSWLFGHVEKRHG